MRRRDLALILPLAFGALCSRSSRAAMAKTPGKPWKTGYVPSNGISYYYEIRGEGEPLLLLHGGLGSIDMFGPVLPALAEKRMVIAVDLQGHGRTGLGRKIVDLKSIGDDMAAILDHLDIAQTDVLGYSFGGGVGLRLAVQHAAKVRRIVLVSTGFASDGFYADMRKIQKTLTAAAAASMAETPMYKSYAAVAPKPEEFPQLLQAMGDLMRTEYNYSEDVKSLRMPVMLVYGDADMYRPEHEIEFFQLLGGGLRDAGWMRETLSQNRLAIIPNRTHYDVFFAPEIVSMTLPFLDGETKVKSWDEVLKEMQQ